MFLLFMKEKNHSTVNFVRKVLLLYLTWGTILLEFIKENSMEYAKYVNRYICSSKYTWNKSILNLFMKKRSHFSSVKCVNETSRGVFIWRIMLPEFKRKLLDVHSAAMDVLLKRTWMGLLRAFMTKRSLTNVNFSKKFFKKGSK